MPTGWGYFVQGSDQLQEVDELGRKLSLILHCSIHYPAWNKPYYECHCGCLFPLWAVRSCLEMNDWTVMITEHLSGYRPYDGDML